MSMALATTERIQINSSIPTSENESTRITLDPQDIEYMELLLKRGRKQKGWRWCKAMGTGSGPPINKSLGGNIKYKKFAKNLRCERFSIH
jgi:hypothetical protein